MDDEKRPKIRKLCQTKNEMRAQAEKKTVIKRMADSYDCALLTITAQQTHTHKRSISEFTGSVVRANANHLFTL